ncbi:hypothetical protein A0H76_1156 [Hepatospora eriocheir]|uniref:Uncharacterized protein n=1 Tax=Hepatospora eriocheir TaxID=1081669 RepID=A0A1X0QHL1_9MICR|nr:hypothetical protein A0H76_1156 [Hepatospora eriocheir]
MTDTELENKTININKIDEIEEENGIEIRSTFIYRLNKLVSLPSEGFSNCIALTSVTVNNLFTKNNEVTKNKFILCLNFSFQKFL